MGGENEVSGPEKEMEIFFTSARVWDERDEFNLFLLG